MPHYLVAYGHVIRSEKAESEAAAQKAAFGIVDNRRCTVQSVSTIPRRMRKGDIANEQKTLAVKHFRRTGSVISGYEKEPGIDNVHWTECLLCLRSILTEPKDSGTDENCCQECWPKVYTVPEAERNEMSTAALRNRLKIVKVK